MPPRSAARLRQALAFEEIIAKVESDSSKAANEHDPEARPKTDAAKPTSVEELASATAKPHPSEATAQSFMPSTDDGAVTPLSWSDDHSDSFSRPSTASSVCTTASSLHHMTRSNSLRSDTLSLGHLDGSDHFAVGDCSGAMPMSATAAHEMPATAAGSQSTMLASWGSGRGSQRRPGTVALRSARDRWRQTGSPSMVMKDYRRLWQAATADVDRKAPKPNLRSGRI